MRYKNNSDFIIRLSKTAFIAVGAQTLRLGAIVLFLDDATEAFSLSDEVKYTSMAIAMIGMSYARFFTRTLTLWNKFKPSYMSEESTPLLGGETIQASAEPSALLEGESKSLRWFSRAVFVMGSVRATFLAMNAYASIHALLKLFGMKEGAAVYTLGAYAVFANFINFQAYSVSMMVKNSEKLYSALIDRRGEKPQENNAQAAENNTGISSWDMLKVIRTALVSLFGLAAFAVFSYNLTRKAFAVIPGLRNASEATAGTVAVVSGATSLITSILGKGLTLHSSLDKSPQKIIAGVSDGYRHFIPFHLVFGAIYVLSMAAMYFVGTLNIAKEKHWDYLSAASLSICSAVAFSGGLLELSFTALKMFDHISKKVTDKLSVQSAGTGAYDQISGGNENPLSVNAAEAVNDVTGQWYSFYRKPPEADLAAMHVAAAGWS